MLSLFQLSVHKIVELVYHWVSTSAYKKTVTNNIVMFSWWQVVIHCLIHYILWK